MYNSFPTWIKKYGGIPPFDQILIADFKDEILASIVDFENEIEQIVGNKEEADFANTIEVFEKCGKRHQEVMAVFYVWSTSKSDGEFQKVEAELTPTLAAFADKIIQNQALFDRIAKVYDTRNLLNAEQKRLTTKHYDGFVFNGAALDETKKKELAKLNQSLATLYTQFSQLLMESENTYLTLDAHEVASLPPDMKAFTEDMAKARGLAGNIVSNTRSSIELVLTYCPLRSLREKAWRLFVERGDTDSHDTKPLCVEIIKLRSQRAALLGYKSHAHWRLSNKMAKTPETALELLYKVWPHAQKRVSEEVADMQEMVNGKQKPFHIEPWDYRYFAELVRKEKYDLDENDIKPYLVLDNMVKAMFWVANELFEVVFEKVNDVPTFHPTMSVYKMTQKGADGVKGLWYFDPYAREGKRSGAWMMSYQDQHKLDAGAIAIVSNNSNFIQSESATTLLSWDEAITLFHEFGHALHGLLSDVTYPKLSGTSVASDFVELPSQLYERWLLTPEVLNKFALHYETGHPIPQELLDKIIASSKFNSGFNTVEYMACALLDMHIHLAQKSIEDLRKFEQENLAKIGMPSQVTMRHRLPQFAHIFSDDGYSAGYYSYMWADVLSADAYRAFQETGNPFDKNTAAKLLEHVYSAGGKVDEAETYIAFRGQDAAVEALLEAKGFA
jgi:peptidyl-dipeptidase Dcp